MMYIWQNVNQIKENITSFNLNVFYMSEFVIETKWKMTKQNFSVLEHPFFGFGTLWVWSADQAKNTIN